MPVIGMLVSGSRASSDRAVRAFHQGLAESGYIENRNVAVEYRWGEDRNERFPQLAAELVERGERGPQGNPGLSGATLREWKIDRARYVATPVMSDGRDGPPLELRALFEQFLSEVR